MSLLSRSPRTPRTAVGLRVVLVLAGALLAAALPAAVAQADSIVYLKDGNVWIAHTDGSGARQFTRNAYDWSSPSEADDGTVVAAGGLDRTNPGGTNSVGSSELYRFSGDGNELGEPIPTGGSYSSPACPTFGPTSVRVSPDATKIAYGIWTCGDPGFTALWTPATATDFDFPNQTLGQEDFYHPAWIDSSKFTVSSTGPVLFGARWFVHLVSGADNASEGAWNEPDMTGTAQGVISRDGSKMVAFEDDQGQWTDLRTHNVTLWLYTGSSSTRAPSPAAGGPGAVSSRWTPRRRRIPSTSAPASRPTAPRSCGPTSGGWRSRP